MSRSPTFLQAIPYAVLTAVGMLATDLYLPGVPVIARSLGASVEASQATLSSFFAGLAISQLAWGYVADRGGPRRALVLGMGTFVLSSVACALAPSIAILIASRFVQGIGAGATTVIVPVLVRRDFHDDDAVRALSWVGISEAIIPAAGPILGALLLLVASWRVSFAIVAVLGVVASAFAMRRHVDTRALVTPLAVEPSDDSPAPSFIALTGRFARLASSHALALGSLIAFVASAPQLLVHRLSAGPSAFAMMQVAGVAGFALCASRTGAIASTRGARFTAQLGAGMQLVGALAFSIVDLAGTYAYVVLVAAWVTFCAGLGFRGPVVFAASLDVPKHVVGRASAIIMLACQLVAALLTAALAPSLRAGFTWTGVALTSAAIASWALLRVLPAARSCPVPDASPTLPRHSGGIDA